MNVENRQRKIDKGKYYLTKSKMEYKEIENKEYFTLN